MRTKRITPITLMIVISTLSWIPSPAKATSNNAVSLSITSIQESVLTDGKKMIVLFCAARGLALLELRSSMNLTVQVGDQAVTFRANGTKSIRTDPAEQDYSISGSSSLICRARDRNGNESRIEITYSYMGDGQLKLSETDVNKSVPLTLKQLNSRVVAMDLQSGHGEVEITLGLQK